MGPGAVTLADVFYAAADRYAPRVAVTDVRSGRSITYEALARDADRVAAFLRAQGVTADQRIGLVAPNGPAYLPAAFGLLATGACLVPVPTNLAPPEMDDVLREIDVNACLSAPAADPRFTKAGGCSLAGGECDGFTFEWIDREAKGPPDLGRLAPAFIRFTSGTTARSKGVVLSHAATIARVAAADRVLGFTADDRVAWVLPLAYHFAVTIVAYVRAGAHILMCPDTLPRSLADAVQRFAATVLYASPFHFERLANLRPGNALESLRLALSTSAPLTETVIRGFEEASGIPLAQAYGIIEAGLPCINARRDGLPASSLGRPVPGYEVAVFSDDGVRVPAGVAGEVAVRGPGLFSAYYSPWQPSEAVMRNGWFFTGDVGRQDDGGALSLIGRKKTVIFVAGMKFFPDEVEACINVFAGVEESRVFGRPHPRLGQVPHAEIALASGTIDLDALRAHCARALSPHKVPVEFTVVPVIAKTPGGKVLRR